MGSPDNLDELINRTQQRIDHLDRLAGSKPAPKQPLGARLSSHLAKHGNLVVNAALAGCVFAVAWGQLRQKYEHQVRDPADTFARHAFIITRPCCVANADMAWMLLSPMMACICLQGKMQEKDQQLAKALAENRRCASAATCHLQTHYAPCGPALGAEHMHHRHAGVAAGCKTGCSGWNTASADSAMTSGVRLMSMLSPFSVQPAAGPALCHQKVRKH